MPLSFTYAGPQVDSIVSTDLLDTNYLSHWRRGVGSIGRRARHHGGKGSGQGGGSGRVLALIDLDFFLVLTWL